jgi:hypothetical protein
MQVGPVVCRCFAAAMLAGVFINSSAPACGAARSNAALLSFAEIQNLQATAARKRQALDFAGASAADRTALAALLTDKFAGVAPYSVMIESGRVALGIDSWGMGNLWTRWHRYICAIPV